MNQLIFTLIAFLSYVSSAKLDHLKYLPPRDENQPMVVHLQSAYESNFGQEPPVSKLSNSPSLPTGSIVSSRNFETQPLGINFLETKRKSSDNELERPAVSSYSRVEEYPVLFTPKPNLEHSNVTPRSELSPLIRQSFGSLPQNYVSNDNHFSGIIKNSDSSDTYSQLTDSNIALNSFLNNQNEVDHSGELIQYKMPNIGQNSFESFPSSNTNSSDLTGNPFFNGQESSSSDTPLLQNPTQLLSSRSITTEHIPILRAVFNKDVEGTYQYAYETANNIAAFEEGDARFDGTKAEGYYGYISPEGKKIEVTYTADERGFLPQGEHIPTAPPVPKAIQRALEYIRKVEAEKRLRGEAFDDGQYRENYSNEETSNQIPQNSDEMSNEDGFVQNLDPENQRFDLLNSEEKEDNLENKNIQVEGGDTMNKASFPTLERASGLESFLPFSDPTKDDVPENQGRRTNRFKPQEKESSHEGYRY